MNGQMNVNTMIKDTLEVSFMHWEQRQYDRSINGGSFMNSKEQLRELKKQISLLIRSYSDRGFLPYGGCNRVCHELSVLLKRWKACLTDDMY